MRTRLTELYEVSKDNEAVYFSDEPLTLDEVKDWHFYDAESEMSVAKIEKEIPVVVGRIERWNGGGTEIPHVHYVCPKCRVEHNVDLEENDPNPRFGCCDSCGWDSMVWIEWK